MEYHPNDRSIEIDEGAERRYRKALEEIREWIVGWYRGDKEGCLMAEINRIAVRALAPEPGTNEPEMGTIEKLAEEQGVSEFNLKENIGAFPDLPDLESCRQNGDS